MNNQTTQPLVFVRPRRSADLEWYRWRAILDRVTTRPDYNYNTPYPRKRLLLNLADFACAQLAIHNRGHR